jgi:hypothetical protein
MVYNTQNYWVFGLFPSSGTCLHKIFPFLCIGAHALGFVDHVRSTNFNLLIQPSSTHVGASSQFYCVIFLSPAELAWSQMIK